MDAYRDFAKVYDLLMAEDYDYPSWADHYFKLLDRAGAGRGFAFDCGCGTGRLTIELPRRFARVMGSDISEDMLEIASQRARDAGAQIVFARQDMREIDSGKKADAILATCDAVNYLLSEAAVSAFFSRARNLLKPGGALAFDISSRHKLEHIIAGNDFFEDGEDAAYIWRSSPPDKNRVVEMDITFFTPASGGLYRRFQETHRQRAHDEREIALWLKRAGFQNISAYGDMTFEAPREDSRRVHFIAT